MRALAVRSHGLREMLRLLRRRPGSFLLAVLLSAAALAVSLTGASLARVLVPALDDLALGPEINLFLAPATATTEIRQLQTQLAARPIVERVEWITREAAFKSLAQRTGSTALGELKSNPLPDVLVVNLRASAEPDSVETMANELRGLPRVESVASDTGWHRKLAALLRTAATAGLFGAGMAVALLVLIVLGAVQLQLATSRDDLRVLQLVGADDRFITRPFAYAGALTLGCGAGLAAGLTAGALAALGPQLEELASIYGVQLAVQALPAAWLAATVAGAAAVGGATAALGARWALRSAR